MHIMRNLPLSSTSDQCMVNLTVLLSIEFLVSIVLAVPTEVVVSIALDIPIAIAEIN